MKRPGQLLDQIAAPANLLEAYLKARRGKTQQAEVRAFAARLDAELGQMRADLLAGRCRFDRYRTFRVYDPKERLIHAAPFPDRVLHHAVLNVCEPYFERAQVFDSYACRKGKGTRAALLRARDFARRYPCYLKLDVRKYFASIGHEPLKDMLRRMFKDQHLLALLETVIDGCPENGTGSGSWKLRFSTGSSRIRENSDSGLLAVPRETPPNSHESGYAQLQSSVAWMPGASPRFGPRGLPIGNLTSQYFANHFLTPLDQHLKRVLRVPGYIRYMDDFVLWGYSTRDLLRWEREARKFCAERLGLELKPPCINQSAAGLPFLGFLVLPGELRLTSHSCRRLRRKLKACQRRLDRGAIDEECAAVTVRSLLARTDWSGGAALRRRLLADDFGRRPKARTASTGAVAGRTTPATAAVRTATTGTGATATTTSASGWFWLPAQENGRDVLH
jgi:RNA-directed DNA polymerase